MPRPALPRRLGHEQTVELADHLGELRHRLVLCLLAFVPAFVLAFAFHARIVELLARPLPEDKQLVTLGVTEPFTTSVKVSLIAAVALTLPVLLSQLWAFFAPALTPAVQRTIGGFVLLATGLFAAGVLFSYSVVLPRALGFLLGFDEQLYDIQVRASYYYAFAAMTLLATGLAFQLPIALLALVRLGALTAAKLRRNRRLAYVGLVAFAILLPTVDPVSLALEVAPLIGLFELSIVLATVMERRWAVPAAVASNV
jgi:sec-independent protein translocase protein TatC